MGIEHANFIIGTVDRHRRATRDGIFPHAIRLRAGYHSGLTVTAREDTGALGIECTDC